MRQKSLQIDGLKHSAPIPSGCRIGPVLTTSVITGRDPVTNQVPADADGQVRLCFENLKRLLAAGGLGLADVAKVTCFVADDGIRDVINKYWVQCWPDAAKRPARHTINLAPRGGFLVQIDALAVAADA